MKSIIRFGLSVLKSGGTRTTLPRCLADSRRFAKRRFFRARRRRAGWRTTSFGTWEVAVTKSWSRFTCERQNTKPLEEACWNLIGALGNIYGEHRRSRNNRNGAQGPA